MAYTRRTVSGWAGLASLLVHLGWFVSPLNFWNASDADEDTGSRLEAVLVSAQPFPEPRLTPKPVVAPALERAPEMRAAPIETPAAALPEPPPAPTLLSTQPQPVTLPVPQPVTQPAPVAPAVAGPTPPVSAPAKAAVVDSQPPPLNPLPAQMSVQYAMSSSEHGFTIGAASYLWQRDGLRYRAESRLKTTGIVALFVAGGIHLTSTGRIGADGLQPEAFSQRRGERRPDVAVFDYAAGQLTLNDQPEGLRAGAQDLVSFLFQLALRFHPEQGSLILPVTDGRKLRGYRMASPEVDTREGRRLWRLHAWRDGDGELDLWFAADQPGLPVLMRSLDRKGEALWLRRIEPQAAQPGRTD